MVTTPNKLLSLFIFPKNNWGSALLAFVFEYGIPNVTLNSLAVCQNEAFFSVGVYSEFFESFRRDDRIGSTGIHKEHHPLFSPGLAGLETPAVI